MPGGRRPPDPQSTVETRIRANVENILKSWMAQVRLAVPGAAQLDEESLKNGLPEFLHQLADVISTTGQTARGERSSIETLRRSQLHGMARAKQARYTLDQVISEYRILRNILFSTLEATGGIKNREREKLLESIDYGIMAAAVQFTAALGFRRASAADLEKKDLQIQLVDSRRERDEARERSEELARIAAELDLEKEMRERFVSALTHDLRNPLAAASMRAQLIRKRAGQSPTLMTLTSQLSHDLERADQMIRDLLDANAIRAGQKLPLNIEEADVTALIKDTLAELAVVHGERFQLKAPPSFHAFLDKAGVRRIIENLCNNAIKYGEAKSQVTVRLEERGADLQLVIHNEGPALSLADQKSLFNQFRRSDTAKGSGKRGWGLGLTLVRGMAEAHGGSVEVESSENKGTTFSVTLPRDARKVLGVA